MARVAKKKKPSLPPIKCKGCGTNFVPDSRRQRYHSATCREDTYSRVYFSKTSAQKTCPNCRMKFMTTKPGRQDYCHPDCREEARIKRRDGVIASVSAERKTFLGDRFAAMEKDGFKCVFCGKGPHDGVKLDVEDDGKGGIHTVCNLCVEGRGFNSAVHNVGA